MNFSEYNNVISIYNGKNNKLSIIKKYEMQYLFPLKNYHTYGENPIIKSGFSSVLDNGEYAIGAYRVWEDNIHYSIIFTNYGLRMIGECFPEYILYHEIKCVSFSSKIINTISLAINNSSIKNIYLSRDNNKSTLENIKKFIKAMINDSKLKKM